MLYKPDQPIVPEFVEKRSNIEIQNPIHFLPHDSHPQRVKCILLSASRPETVAETQKVLFPYLVEDRPYRGLDDFILQCRDSQWPLPPIGFRDPGSSRRSCSIGSAIDSSMYVAKLYLQVSSIFFPRHPIHSWRRLFLRAVTTVPEHLLA